MYTKTEGHHCWWLNKNGKAVANFDNESDVDEIINTHKVAQLCVYDMYSYTGKVKKKTAMKLMALCQNKTLSFPE